MASFFDIFPSQPVTLYLIDPKSEGNRKGTSYQTTAVFKLRDGMETLGQVETKTSDATVWLRPEAGIVDATGKQMTGHLVEIARGSEAAVLYRVTAQTEGYDYDLERMDFYKLELRREDPVWASDLPLV